MYNIAVIENETELQRYGHANVTRNLRASIEKQKDSKYFKFVRFTSTNIEKLFFDREQNLSKFDALFISTNACSDSVVYKCLCENKTQIIDFVENGLGIYVGYQKRQNIVIKELIAKTKEEYNTLLNEYTELSSNMSREKYDDYISRDLLRKLREKINIEHPDYPLPFLPDKYNYKLIEEYVILRENLSGQISLNNLRRKESNEGNIKVNDINRTDVILINPNSITANDIENRCRNNDFQNHLYKSSIYFKYDGNYKVLLYDDSPYNDSKRVLLARAIPRKAEKILVSSIAFDWENHTKILCNILEYIVKGVPKYAFIRGKSENSEFNYLLNNAKISKIAYCEYNSIESINVDMREIHDTYFFAPDISEEEVDLFWNIIKRESERKKFYHLLVKDCSSDDLQLKLYSNSSSLEKIKNNVSAWINSYYLTNSKGGYWDGFWVTYETLRMLKFAGIEYNFYLDGISKAIKKQRREDGSYDKLIGCTLGMLVLLYEFWEDSKEEIDQTEKWIKEHVFIEPSYQITQQIPISNYEKESFLLTFYELSNSNATNINFATSEYEKLIHNVYESYVNPEINQNECTEIELCRHLKFCRYFNKNETDKVLSNLIARRDSEGKWINVGRTAQVLICLLTVFSKEEILELKLEKKIEEGINYILSNYNSSVGNWNDLVLDTSRSLCALILYDNLFSIASKDFFEIVQKESEVMGSDNIVRDLLSTTTSLQTRILSLNNEIMNCNNDNFNLKEGKAKLQKKFDNIEAEYQQAKGEYEKNETYYENLCRFLLGLTIFFGLLVAGMIAFICFKLDSGKALVNETGTYLATVIGLLLSFITERFLHRKLLRKNKKANKKEKKNENNTK